MAMILDDIVMNAPIPNAMLSDSAQIQGSFSEEEARSLARVLRAGALDVRPVLVSERPKGR